MPSVRRRVACALCLAVSLLISTGASAQEDDLVVAAAGIFDITDLEDEAPEGRLEYLAGYRVLDYGPYFRGFGPVVGIMANGDGGVFGYGGVFADIRLDERVMVRPEAGLGGDRRGDSRELGGVFQFHLSVDVAYRFDGGQRLGITFAHISNASVNGRNPGNDSLLLTFAVPLDRAF
jgi:hypothetical protein